ncbi:MAG: response regulator [Aliidongia sp.]
MNGARVMVVEDERIVAMHLQQQLLKLGYDVPAPVASSEMALRQAEELRPDLVLMDIHIEGKLDGIETAAAMAEKREQPVIYLTAYSEPATLDRARATKPYGYLIKPFSERELHATIQMALERCRAEKAQRDGEATLRQAQKMEAIGLLAGGVAHDFNNLLGVIIGNLDRVAERDQADPEILEMVRDALGAALRGAGLTRQLLAYSRRQTLDPHVVKLDRAMTDLTALLRRTLGEPIQIETVLPEDLRPVRIDVNQFENALLNLAVNARDAMPQGGLLTIEAGNVELAQADIDGDGDAAPGAYVRVAVTDTGIGMTAEVAERAFEPFFTTKPAGAGTGLGLSMIYGFVRQSRGLVKIISEIERGTRVELFFPAAATADEGVQKVTDPIGTPVARPGETVLLVEDDAALRKLISRLLVALGYGVIEAEDAPMALSLLDRTDRLDLLLTDVVLPKGMGGPALAREARSRRPGLKSLYMSGYTRNALDGDAAGESVPLLTKPFRKSDLARRLRQVLDTTDPA